MQGGSGGPTVLHSHEEEMGKCLLSSAGHLQELVIKQHRSGLSHAILLRLQKTLSISQSVQHEENHSKDRGISGIRKGLQAEIFVRSISQYHWHFGRGCKSPSCLHLCCCMAGCASIPDGTMWPIRAWLQSVKHPNNRPQCSH